MSILSRFAAYSDKPALIGVWGACTYGRLAGLVEEAGRALADLRLPGPAAVAVVGGHGPAAAAWLLALEATGHFAVPLSGNPAEHPARLAQVNAQWVVTADGLSWSLLPRIDEASAHPLFLRLKERGSAGLVLFTSGTSGRPKAMVQDFRRLLASYEGRHASRLPVLALLGFDHIGGLNTLFGCLASGSPLVVSASLTPSDVAAAIALHRVAVLPASPTFLNLLLVSGEAETRDLSSLRVITYGTEPMPESLLARLRAAFPRARFIQTFGTSETGITRAESPSQDSTFIRFDDPALEWKVVDDELWLRSRTQIDGYLDADNSRFTPDGWFRTGDRVELGPEGTLRVLGRMGELINVGGEKLMPAEVESVVLAVKGVRDCRVRGEPHALTGQTVVADVVAASSADQEALRAAVRNACRARLARHKVPTRVTFVPAVSGERLKKVR
ncbi:MAG: long-chain fatty acid--CoA ligase [Verrucomicrobia bacterium]|nr:long-chain fatty acid--CoA ligase [Verrucomicrobiota bacterium]